MRIGIGMSLVAAAAVFWPLQLFAQGQPGAWYEPSDLTTLFQDAAGTIPVTAAGQPVGLVLDKSQGLALGPELVVNGDFSNGATGWTVPSPWIVSGGGASATAASSSLLGGGVTPVAGRSYRVDFDVVSYTSGDLLVSVGGNFTGNPRLTSAQLSSGRKSVVVVAGSSPSRGVEFYGGAVTITIDNISVRELAGNHAAQTTNASRPTYGVVPATGRRNLLTWTTFGGAAAGTPGSAPTDWPFNSSGGSITSASGGVIGFSATAARQIIGQAVTVAASQTQTWSVRVVSNPNGLQFFQLFAVINSAGLSTLQYFANGTLVVNTVYVPQAGDVLSARLVNGGTQIAPTFRIGVGASGVATGSASFTEPQAEIGSTVTAYQRVTTAFDVTEAGVQSLSYLSFDGVDDFLVTPTITPNIDKAQVFAGVRKLSDAAQGCLVELGVSAPDGSISLWSPPYANGGFAFWSKGTALSSNAFTATPLSPVTRVIAGLGEISTDTAVLRLNGVQSATSSQDQGTGNYLAYPIFIGRRGGTTFPLSGQLYGLIVRFGANLDAATVSATERWMGSETGVTIA